MATGTNVYDKNNLQIYPVSDGSVIVSNASGAKSTVEADLIKLFKLVSELSGSSEVVNNILINVEYSASDTIDEAEIKLPTTIWDSFFQLPTEEHPYTWKKTTFSFDGASEGEKKVIYEIVASDVSTVILVIYTRTEGVTPVIEYKLKQDSEGNWLYIDSEGNETTEVTPIKAWDYSKYWDGSDTNGLNNLPPTPKGQSYIWTDYPLDISLSYTSVFMSRRLRLSGKWEPFSTPAQYGQWPEA